MSKRDRTPREPDDRFSVDGNVMARSVVPRRGTPYRHTCDLDVFTDVAHAIDGLGGEPFTLESVRAALDAPFTQVAVAIAFLKERGCIVPGPRRSSVAATGSVHLDAMTEWHALREHSTGA